MRRKGLFRLIAGTIGCLGVVFGGVASAAPSGQVVIAKGQPVQIAVAVDDTGLVASFGPSVREAVRRRSSVTRASADSRSSERLQRDLW